VRLLFGGNVEEGMTREWAPAPDDRRAAANGTA
jgi:hypothetical protein